MRLSSGKKNTTGLSIEQHTCLVLGTFGFDLFYFLHIGRIRCVHLGNVKKKIGGIFSKETITCESMRGIATVDVSFDGPIEDTKRFGGAIKTSTADQMKFQIFLRAHFAALLVALFTTFFLSLSPRGNLGG